MTCALSNGPFNRFSVTLADGNDNAMLTTATDGIIVDGGPGNDVLVGGPGDDSLDGEVGNDLIAGAAGDDLLEPGTGSDVLNGGDGTDSAVYTSRTLPVAVDLSVPRADGATDAPDSLASIEDAIGGNANDTLTGDSGPNRLDGNVGADRLVGGGGADDLIGSEGRDRIEAGAGDDTIDLSVSDGQDTDPDNPSDSDFAVDGSADRVSCGSGRDSVLLPEVGDRLASDCELISFDFIVLRRASVRVARRQLRVRIDAVALGRRQRVWVTIKHGGHTTLLGRSSLRRHAGTARVHFNRAGRRLFANTQRHRIRIGDGLDPDAGFVATIRR